MTVEYQKVWRTMNDLEMVTSKICSAREIIDAAVNRIQEHQYDKAEMMMSAAYEYLEYYLQEFDDKFKLAWQATVGDLRDSNKFHYTATGEKMWVDDYCEASELTTPIVYFEEELNAMCDKAASDEEKEKCREYNMREAEYYNKRVELDAEVERIRKAGGYEWTPEQEPKKTLSHSEAIAAGWIMTDDGFWLPPQETSKKKWILPVEQVHDDYFVSFPDDLLKAAKLKEGDEVNWIDNGDGSFKIIKVTKPLGPDEC